MVFGSMAQSMDRSRKISRMSAAGSVEPPPTTTSLTRGGGQSSSSSRLRNSARSAVATAVCVGASVGTTTVAAPPSGPDRPIPPSSQVLMATIPGLRRQSSVRPNAISEETQEDESTFRQYVRIIAPHVGLVVLCVLYTFAGATLFYVVERPHEDAQREEGRREVSKIRTLVIEELWTLTQQRQHRTGGDAGTVTALTFDTWTQALNVHLDNVTNVLLHWYPQHYLGANTSQHTPHLWTYPSALFFSASTITTIGYGNLVPDTANGRILCVVFGLFGIPLMLVTIADIGKFIGDAICYLYAFYARTQLRCRRAFRRQRRRHRKRRRHNADTDDDQNTPTDDSKSDEEDDAEQKELDEMDLLDFADSVPVAWILLIIVGYTALGGVLLPLYEDWTFQESFYFSFITMSTIGFGDFVPKQTDYYALTLLYILLGLAITTMCVDLVGTQYIQKIHHVGRHMKNARAALKTVGDMVRYTAFLRRRYGFTDDELQQMTLERLCIIGPHLAFTPSDINRMYFIDQRAFGGYGDTASPVGVGTDGVTASASLMRLVSVAPMADELLGDDDDDIAPPPPLPPPLRTSLARRLDITPTSPVTAANSTSTSVYQTFVTA